MKSVEDAIEEQKRKKLVLSLFRETFATLRKKPRNNWKKKYEEERNLVINEAIAELKKEMRNPSVPKEWHRGYNSAITKLELLKK